MPQLWRCWMSSTRRSSVWCLLLKRRRSARRTCIRKTQLTNKPNGSWRWPKMATSASTTTWRHRSVTPSKPQAKGRNSQKLKLSLSMTRSSTSSRMTTVARSAATRRIRRPHHFVRNMTRRRRQSKASGSARVPTWHPSRWSIWTTWWRTRTRLLTRS